MKNLNKRNSNVSNTIEAYACYCSCACSCSCDCFCFLGIGKNNNENNDMVDARDKTADNTMEATALSQYAL